ncbi:UNVERIFIED_CONTAM: hypothetical protein K2H54_049946 [Gekko kuhli]
MKERDLASIIANFPNIMRAMDCTHIAPNVPWEEPRVYRNHHQCGVVVNLSVQASCDHQGIFMDLFTKFPGSVHDPQIFAAIDLNLLLATLPEGKEWFLIHMVSDSMNLCIVTKVAAVAVSSA